MSGFRIRKAKGGVCMGGTGIQKLHFFYLFPLINFTLRSISEKFKLYLVFRKIIEFIMADRVYRSELPQFKNLIGEFINGYIEHFDDTLPFKVHHVEHYPEAILEFGLLTNVSTLSSERTLQLFTRSIESSRNSKNLPLSIAKSFTFNIESLFNLEVISEVNFSDIPANYTSLFPENVNKSLRFKELRSITIENTKLDKNCFYLFRMRAIGTGLPVFIKILKIFWSDNRPIIIGQIYSSRCYVEKYQVYGILITDKIGFITVGQILHHKPLYVYTYQNHLFAMKSFYISSKQ